MSGVLITFQGDSWGTIEANGTGYQYRGKTAALKNIVAVYAHPGESPAAFVARLPQVLCGTVSAIEVGNSSVKL